MSPPRPVKALLLIFLAFHSFSLFSDEQNLDSRNDRPQILLLHSYHQGYHWTENITRGVREVLGEEAVIHVEFMDSKRYSEDDYLQVFKELMRIKSASMQYDLIICADDNALEFMKSNRDDFYGPIPLVFCGINFFQPESLAGFYNVTGISEESDFSKNLDLIRQLYPNRTNLVCILDETVTGKSIRTNLDAVLNDYKDDFTSIEVWSDISMADMLRDLNLLGEDFVVFLLPFQRDNLGKFFEYDISTQLISQAAAVPVFGSWDFQFSHGIIGGYLLQGIDQGRDAGQRALRILKGELAESIPITAETSQSPMFDLTKLLQFSLSLKYLPKGSIIINQPDNFFYRYSTEVTIVLVVFSILLLLVIQLFSNILKRRKSEEALKQLNLSLNNRVDQRTQELEYTNSSLKETLEKLQDTQKELIRKERLAALGSLVSGVAHEINTPLGVSITTSSSMEDVIRKLQKQVIEDSLTKENMDDFIARLHDGSRLLGKNLKKAADFIENFKKLSFDEMESKCLSFELKDYIQEITRTHAIQFNNKHIKVQLLGEEIEVYSYPDSFYYIINNLLINSLVHGFDSPREDSLISITLSLKEGKTGMIEYKDNGKGIPVSIREHMFEPFTTTGRSEGKTGLGLYIVFKTIKERLGGAIEYMPPPEDSESGGSCFRIYFPINISMDNCW
ncbi:sensor histidine kinase [Oceanispirochaeta sp.]|jgi:signal transduction histidine kinase|uniref:sensor histidine kinase n=1 Tax=Oceanispirochaeta sp. TaxID=2035350 RepID=UPI00262A7991|nr:sensor histidine kinase [Oceanispirochaeta sp.]MDA3957421.1 sensor histidine kinase [Oceanispirochaeta sp.]